MKLHSTEFDQAVLGGWHRTSSESEKSSGAPVREIEPGLRMEATYSPKDREVQRARDTDLQRRDPGWSIVARLPAALQDLSWLTLEEGQEDVGGVIASTNVALEHAAREIGPRGLLPFLDPAAPSAGVEAPGSGGVILHDPLSASLGKGRRSFAGDGRANTVDARHFGQAYSSVARVTAALGVASERLVESSLDRLRILFPIDGELLLSIASLRALRILTLRVLAAFGKGSEHVEIWGMAGGGCTCIERQTHQIKLTIASAAAILGSCDVIVAEPFGNDTADADSARLALNVLRILRYESRLGFVEDTMGGAYYIEVLTRRIADLAWQAFLAIEDEGGICAVAESNSLPAVIDRHLQSGPRG